MAEQTKQELARRAVACKHWRWMHGMSDEDGNRVIATQPNQSWLLWSDGSETADDDETIRPDLENPATLGCLLALVREAWSCPGVYARESSRGGWVVCVRKLDPNGPVAAGPFRAPTEATALVAALEAAP